MSTSKLKFLCTYCPSTYTRQHDLNRHLRSHHSDNKKISFCHHCWRFFKTKPLLNLNNWKTLSRPEKSQYITKIFKGRVKTDKNGEFTLFKCDICSKLFVTDEECKSHFKTHKNEQVSIKRTESLMKSRDNYCTYCCEKFTDSESLIACKNLENSVAENLTSVKLGPNKLNQTITSDCSSVAGEIVSGGGKLPDHAILGYKATSLVEENYVKVVNSENCSVNLTVNSNCLNEKTKNCSATHDNNELSNVQTHRGSTQIIFTTHNLKSQKHLHKCSYCGKKFITLIGLRRHISNIHFTEKSSSVKPKSANFTCEFCLRTFKRKVNFKIHKLEYHINSTSIQKQELQKCSFCCEMFSLSDMTIHLRNVHAFAVNIQLKKIPVKIHRCKLCGAKFSNVTSLSMHGKIHLNDNVNARQCLLCDYVFSSRKYLKYHELTFHCNSKQGSGKNLKYSCDFCQQMFVTKSYLSYHIQNHFSTEPGVKNQVITIVPFKTVVFNSEIDSLKNVEKLSNSLNNETKKIQDKTIKNNKVITKSKLLDEKCKFCLQMFSTNDLQTHINLHKKSVPYKCVICCQVFGNSALFQHHLLKYGNLGIACEQCPGLRVHNLGVHNKHYHKNIYQYASVQPSISNLNYKKSDNCNKNAKSGILNYTCHICRKMFKSEEALNLHSDLCDKNTNILEKYTENGEPELEVNNRKVSVCKSSDFAIQTKKSVEIHNETVQDKCMVDDLFVSKIEIKEEPIENYDIYTRNCEEMLKPLSSLQTQNCWQELENVKVKFEDISGDAAQFAGENVDVWYATTSQNLENYESVDKNMNGDTIDMQEEKIDPLRTDSEINHKILKILLKFKKIKPRLKL